MQRFTMILAAILSLLISMQVNADGNQGIIKAEVSFKLLESSSNLRINFNNVKIDNQNQNSIENLNALISFIGLRPITSILVSYQSPPKRFSFKAEEIYKSTSN